MDIKLKSTLDQLIAQIMDDPGKWKRSWRCGMPHNCIGGNQYRGINVLILMMKAAVEGYDTSGWATLKQWNDKGCKIKKGSKSQRVVLWKPIEVAGEDGGEPEMAWLLRSYNVFNEAQVEGWERPVIENPKMLTVEEWLASKGLDKKVGPGASPAYDWVRDAVTMPGIDSFESSSAYYATLMHELVHLTGHKSRCDRDMKPLAVDRPAYALEELVAELGAAFMNTRFGIDPDQHASYLASWLKAFQPHERMFALMNAARLATDAYDWLVDTPAFEKKLTA